MFNRKLKKRIASLEDVLGVAWYSHSEKHSIYYTIDENLYEQIMEINLHETYHRLLDYLKLTEVSYPEKTVIEPIKEKKNAV